MGEAAALDGRWIPILWVSILFHDVFGGTNVVYAEICRWEYPFGSLSVSSMVQDKGIMRLGSLGGEVYCCRCSWGCIFLGVLLGVLKLGAVWGHLVVWGLLDGARKGLSCKGCVCVVVGVRVS